MLINAIINKKGFTMKKSDFDIEVEYPFLKEKRDLVLKKNPLITFAFFCVIVVLSFKLYIGGSF